MIPFNPGYFSSKEKCNSNDTPIYWENRQSDFGEKAKKVKRHFFGHIIPYNPGLRISEEILNPRLQGIGHLAQTMGLHLCKTSQLYNGPWVVKFIAAIGK